MRKATSTDFVISLVGNDFSRTSNNYVGKLRYAPVKLDFCSCVDKDVSFLYLIVDS